jgi:hypothetical protein
MFGSAEGTRARSAATTNHSLENRWAGLARRSRQRTWPRAAGAAVLLTVCLCLLPATRAWAEPQLIPDNALGAHAMLYFDTPEAGDDAVFAEAQAERASTIRLDIFMPQLLNQSNAVDWTWIDRIAHLSRQYHLRVLADLTGMPLSMANCPAGDQDVWDQCPAQDPAAWGQLAGQVAAHLRELPVSFEIWNEPDGSWTYAGTAQQYGAMLAAAVLDIHKANPSALVTNGGMMQTAGAGGASWLEAALSTAGQRAWRELGMLNVHIRGVESSLAPQLRAWRAFAADHGRPRLRIWVTEAGYPADPAYQFDPSFTGGQLGQARYVAAALRSLYHAGAAKIFITERDMPPGSGEFASEGVIAGLSDQQLTDPSPQPRPAFDSCRAFAKETTVKTEQRKRHRA